MGSVGAEMAKVAGSYSESTGNGFDPGGGCSELAWRALDLGGMAG